MVPSPRTPTSIGQVRGQIEAAAKKTPRYLFRFWHSKSDGINTKNRHTPASHYADPDLESSNGEGLFGMSIDELRDTARIHLEAKNFPNTCFSSWSQSLPLMLAVAEQYRGDSELHIDVLDTEKLAQTRSTSIVVSAVVLGQIIGEDFSCYRHDFLAYGTVSEPSMTSVLYTDMCFESGFATVPWPRKLYDPEPGYEATPRDRADRAVRIANLFGGAWELPVAAHLLSMCRDDLQHRLETPDFLSDMGIHVPEELRFISQDIEHQGFFESLQATVCIKRAALRTANVKGLWADQPIAQFDVIQDERKATLKALRDCKRIPEMNVGWYELVTQKNTIGLAFGPSRQIDQYTDVV